MDKQWTELSPEKKREARFQRWLSPENVKFRSPEAEQLYKGRVTRLIKAIKLQEPDRVPVHLPYGFFPAFYAGGTLQSVMYDYDELRRSWTKFIHDFDMDTYIGPSLVFPARALENLNYRVFKWPGYGLAPDASTYQFVEGENMKADEYDAFISNPADFMQRSFLPRIMGVLEPLQHLSPLNHMMGIPMGYIAPYGRPDVQSALKTLMEAGQEIMKWQEAVAECNREALESGLPTFFGGGGGVPFDAIGDFLRGTQGIMMDMFRQPEKLHEAMEKIMPTGIRMAISGANASGVPIVAFALHKGDDSFMSLKQFEAFYWSYLKRVLLALIDEGLVPLLFAEGNYTKRLDIIKELPRSGVVWWFERTDITLAKKVLGDTACIAGNVPPSLLCTGTPREVKECCRQLIEVCGKGGGFILTGGADMNKGNPDNLHAMMEAAKEYGTYG